MKKICPYCHTVSALYFQSKDCNRHITEESFNHYRCHQCGLIFIDPIPSNLGAYYPDAYHDIPQTQEYLEMVSKPEQYKLELVQRFAKTGKLLEIGPSHGGFTYLAKKSGFDVDAIEMDARCCKFLNEVVGVRAINSNDPSDALQHTGTYDVIAMWHVIEHLPNPWLLLDTLSKKINSNGVLVISSVNPNAFQFHVLGRCWLHLDAPRHVMLIPISLLQDKLQALGLMVEMITTTDAGTLACNVGGWRFFFAKTCIEKYLPKFVWPIFRRPMDMIGKLISFLVGSIERSQGKGSAYTLVMRKVPTTNISESLKK
jgi:protein-L-isoaspartate O-methyltransferase